MEALWFFVGAPGRLRHRDLHKEAEMIFDEFEMEKSVKLAADVLDEMYPKWEEAIDLGDGFYMYDAECCVLGQLARSLENEQALHYSDLFSEVGNHTNDDPEVMVAFDLEYTEEGAVSTYQDDGWDRLREVWRRTIRARR